MKHFTLIISLILISCFTFSQDKSFDLSKYKLPDIKRHTLDLSFSASASNSISEYKQDGAVYENEYAHNNSYAYLHYNYRKNTRKKIVSISSSVNPYYYLYKHYESSNKPKDVDSRLSFNVNHYHAKYLKEDKLFLLFQPELKIETERDKIYRGGEIDRNTIENMFRISTGFGIGLGRIEQVEDLWQSYYILSKLEKQNSLVRKVKKQDVFELADLTTQLKNERFFDFRLRKIAELKAVDSLLHKQELLIESDIEFFTTLNDYWGLANYFQRSSGRELKLTLSPDYEREGEKMLDQDKVKKETFSVIPELTFRCSKQLNLHWERNFFITSSYRYILDEKNHSPENELRISSQINYCYYPNFRTSVRASLHYLGQNNSFISYQTGWSHQATLNCKVKYYISPQLALSGELALNYAENDFSMYDNTFWTRYNLGLNYAIF